MAWPESARLTEAEYLAFERASETKHEYCQGEVVALAGASRTHGRIVLNLGSRLDARLGDGPCEVYVSDLRVRIGPARRYCYPDIVVVCGEPQFEDAQLDTLLNPTAIIEVLSPSTELDDRDRKFRAYRALPSLREYLLVAQTEPRVEQYRRQETGLWLWGETIGLDATVDLPSLGCQLALSEIYRRVHFP